MPKHDASSDEDCIASHIIRLDLKVPALTDPFDAVWTTFLEFIECAAATGDADARSAAAAAAPLRQAAARLRQLDMHAVAAFVCAASAQGRTTDALRVAQAVARAAPHDAGALFTLGLALQFAGRHAEAVAPYRQALAIWPDFPHLRNNLAGALIQINTSDSEALALLEAATRAAPDDSRAWINLTRLFAADADPARALAAGERALELAPRDPSALNNYAMMLKEAQRWDDALRIARTACQYAPDDAVSRFNLALLELVRGDCTAGWRGHELRWRGARELKSGRPGFAAPQWHGEPLAGRTLLLWGEQGMGDLLQFCRYVPMLAERVHREGGRLVWNSFPQMGALLERSFAGQFDQYSAGGGVEALPAHDCEVSLLSLPMLFDTQLATIPARSRYLTADAEAVARWRERLAHADNADKRGTPTPLRVGLAWTGSRAHQRNPYRRVGLERYAAHFAGLGDVAFYSLQPDAADDVAAARSAGFDIADYSAEWRTFDDTAAFIDALDLVITVCTSSAHLAGALGQRTWVLLDVNPHWVWLLDRPDSPWYSHTTLYRQPRLRDWEPVLQQVRTDLAALAAGR